MNSAVEISLVSHIVAHVSLIFSSGEQRRSVKGLSHSLCTKNENTTFSRWPGKRFGNGVSNLNTMTTARLCLILYLTHRYENDQHQKNFLVSIVCGFSAYGNSARDC